MAVEVTFPVQVLREHATTLEAALSVCLADPAHKPVHRLRTETRRVEAQLLLLAQLPEVPEHRDESAALRKQLKKLRRAAGEVRDLDVQRKLLDDYVDPEPAHQDAAAEGASAPGRRARGLQGSAAAKEQGRKAAGDAFGAMRAAVEPAPVRRALAEGASDLRGHIGSQRDHAAADLQKLLKKRQTKTAAAAEALLKVLHPAQEVQLPAEQLLRHAQGIFEREGLLADSPAADLNDDELHSLRKAAKAARYLAETLPEDPLAKKAAERFEALQQAGGEWHDLMDLARASRHHLGKSHELTVELAAERDRRLETYRQALQQGADGATVATAARAPKSARAVKAAKAPAGRSVNTAARSVSR